MKGGSQNKERGGQQILTDAANGGVMLWSVGVTGAPRVGEENGCNAPFLKGSGREFLAGPSSVGCGLVHNREFS